MGNVLSEDEVALFHKQGFLAPLRALGAIEAGDCFERIRAFEKQYGRGGNEFLRLKSHRLLPWIANLAQREEILDAVEDLIGSNIRLCVSSIFSKEGSSPAFVSWHQDSGSSGLTPHDSVTVWVAFTESTVANGCLKVLPGTHLGADHAHQDTYAEDNLLARGQTIVDIDDRKAVHLELQPGQFSIHHEKTIHGSGLNTTPHRRIGFSFVYVPPHVRPVGERRRASLLVRGTDNFGYWDDESVPQAEMEPTAVASLERMLNRYRETAQKATADQPRS